MPRVSIRDFSGGLVTNQSEFDLRDNQYTVFSKVKNKKPGQLERPNVEQTVSGEGDGLQKQTELVLYRTEKDGSNNDVSTQWWLYSSGIFVQRLDKTQDRKIQTLSDTTPNPTGAWTAGGSYTNISPQGGSTTGSGATFDITTDGLGNPTFAINSPGTGYTVGDTLFFKDSIVGGATSNQATITIATVTGFENVVEGWSGADVIGDILIHNQIARLSDCTFANSSKWYGHIKRGVFGNTEIANYTNGYAFRPPPMNSGVNEWYVEDAKLTPPTVVRMDHAFDQSNEVNAANEVGIYIHYPSDTSEKDDLLIDNVSNDTFKTHDKYTVTFIYDYLQESELARDSNGNIGIESYESVPSSGERCPGIQLVMHTGSSLADFNKRITGINIYWKPEDDIDWYLVSTVDIDNGFKDSALSELANKTLTSTASNNGKWIPCLGVYSSTNSFVNAFAESNSVIRAASTPPANFTADNIVFMAKGQTASSTADVFPIIGKTGTRIGNIRVVNTIDNEITPGFGVNTISMVNHSNEGSDAFTVSGARLYATTVSTTKVATWYIPYDGLKLATYNSLTGRAVETKINEIKWNTAAIVNNGGYYANIDTVDENAQTAREKNRVYYTDPYKLDEILATRYFDIGRNDGDEIVKLCSYRNRLFAVKKNTTYVYNTLRKMERVFVGVGAAHKHAVFETPVGLVCANKSGVYAITESAVRELSFPIRETYQSLTLDQPMVGYDGLDNELLIVPDFNGTTIYVMNMDNGSWILRDIESSGARSNFVISTDLRAQYLECD
jgi:hypothetical protein|tara:strand:+ start:2172 stop:4520 length:2349 start_codon:yes stop_codon:yes gene_type:complete